MGQQLLQRGGQNEMLEPINVDGGIGCRKFDQTLATTSARGAWSIAVTDHRNFRYACVSAGNHRSNGVRLSALT